MNKIFKSKFNKTLGSWVAVSELVKGFCKNSKVVAVGVALVATAGIVEAKQTITEEVEITESVVLKKDVTVDGDVFLNGFRIHAGGPTFIIDHVNPYPNPTYFNVQIGIGASAQGQQSFAIGQYSEANGSNNFALGHYARAQGDNTTAFGYNSYASIGSVSVGNNNVAMWNSFASGQHNYAFTNQAVSVGLHNASYGKNAISIGAANTSTTEAASSMGVFNYAGPSNLLGSKEVNGVMTPRLLDVLNALPYEPISNKPEDQLSAIYINSIKARLWNTSKYWQNSGLTFTTNDYDSLKYLSEKEQQEISKAIEKAGNDWPHNHQSAVGNFNTVTGGFASGFGTYNTAIGDESSAFGHNNLSLGTFSSAIGSWNVSLGTASTAVGMRNIASAENSVAVGYTNRASGYDAIAIGIDNYSKNDATTSDGSNLGGTSLVRWVQGSIGIGIGNDVGDDALGFGNGNVVNARSIAVGTKNSILNNGISVNNSQIIIDENKKIGNSYGVVFGYNNKIYSGRSASTTNVNISGSHNFVQNAEQSSIFGFKNYLGALVDFTDVRPDKDPKVKELNVYKIYLATVIGNQNYSSASKSIVIGHSNGLTYGAQSSIVIGSNIKANRANAIYLGINASTNGYQKVTMPKGAKWAGTDNKEGKDWVMTIGLLGQERQIQHVAAGRVTEDSTDAINGSQLYWFKKSLDEKIGELLPAIADEKGTTVEPNEDKVVIGGGVPKENNKPENFTTGNITTETEIAADGKNTGKLNIKLAKNLKGLESAEFVDENGNGTVITKDGIKTVVKEKDSEGKDVIKEIAMGTSYVGDDGNKVDVPLNKTLNLKGGATDVSNEDNIGVVKGNDNTLNVRLAKNLKGIESIDGLKEMSYDDMQDSSNDNKAVSVKSMKNYIEKYGTPGESGGSDFNGDAGGKEITNLKPGTKDDSAATVGQVKDANNKLRKDLEGKINTTRKDALGGAAMAMAVANLPQATIPGEKTVSVAAGIVDGRSAYAIGISTTSPTGRWKLRGSLTGSDQGQVGGGIGAGYSWK